MTHRQCRMLLLLGMLQAIGLILWYDTEQTVDLQFGGEINQEGLTDHWEALTFRQSMKKSMVNMKPTIGSKLTRRDSVRWTRWANSMSKSQSIKPIQGNRNWRLFCKRNKLTCVFVWLCRWVCYGHVEGSELSLLLWYTHMTQSHNQQERGQHHQHRAKQKQNVEYHSYCKKQCVNCLCVSVQRI